MTKTELKSSIVQIIATINDSSILETLHAQLLKHKVEEDADWFHELSEETKKSIQISREQIKRGEVISHDEVMADIKKLYTKA